MGKVWKRIRNWLALTRGSKFCKVDLPSTRLYTQPHAILKTAKLLEVVRDNLDIVKVFDDHSPDYQSHTKDLVEVSALIIVALY